MENICKLLGTHITHVQEEPPATSSKDLTRVLLGASFTGQQPATVKEIRQEHLNLHPQDRPGRQSLAPGLPS